MSRPGRKSGKLCSLGLCLHRVVFVHVTNFHLLHCDIDFDLSTAQQREAKYLGDCLQSFAIAVWSGHTHLSHSTPCSLRF